MEEYRKKVELTYCLIMKYKMQNRVYWASPIPANADVLKEGKYQHINRCMHSKEAVKILVLWLLGFIWLYELKD